jgi:hypothetical protein
MRAGMRRQIPGIATDPFRGGYICHRTTLIAIMYYSEKPSIFISPRPSVMFD